MPSSWEGVALCDRARCLDKGEEAPLLWGITCPSSKQEKDFNPCPKPVGLKLGHASESPGELVRIQTTGPHLRSLDLMEITWGLRVCISKMLILQVPR